MKWWNPKKEIEYTKDKYILSANLEADLDWGIVWGKKTMMPTAT